MPMALNVPVFGDEGLQIGLGNPHGGAEVVRDQFFLLDPAANTAGRDTKHVGDLVDREEFRRFGFHYCSIALESATASPFPVGVRARSRAWPRRTVREEDHRPSAHGGYVGRGLNVVVLGSGFGILA